MSALITEVHAPDAAAPPPGRTVLEAHVGSERERPLLAALARWLESLGTIEPAAADVRIATAPLAPVDWEAAFRLHHRPLPIGHRLLVAPPWDVPEAPGREVLVIEPGMAFGTGQHETTRTCLEEIEMAVAERQVLSALDVGTGSGVLAMALARLGVPRVVALDLDTRVLPLAREKKMGVMLAGVFNSGILATGAVQGAKFEYAPAPPEVMERVRRIEAVCAKHDTPIRRAAMQFPMTHPAVVSVVLGAVKPSEVESNVADARAKVPAALWSDLKAAGLIDASVPTA